MATTAALAVITFLAVVVSGSIKLGPLGFWLGQVPHMDVPLLIGIVLKLLIFVLEALGLLIKHFVLAMRLLANMMAGHVVLAVLVAFISASAGTLGVFRRGAGQRAGFGGAEHAGVVCGVPASVHFCVFVGTVHRDGRPSPLIFTEA